MAPPGFSTRQASFSMAGMALREVSWEQDFRRDHVEALVLEHQLAGVLLVEMHPLAQRLGARVGVAEQGAADVHGVQLRVREQIGERQRAVADGRQPRSRIFFGCSFGKPSWMKAHSVWPAHVVEPAGAAPGP